MKNLLSDKNIEIASLVYIILPYLIFAIGWLKLPVGIIFCGLIIFSTILYSKNLNNTEVFLKNKNLKYFLITILILLIWCSISGLGGFGLQNNPDWEKNNAIFHDLFFNNWAVHYQDYSLVYYLGFYLPTGLIMKLFGWNIGYLFSFAWGFGGLVLVLYWIKRLSGNFSPLITLLFVFFSGLDILGLLTKFSLLNDTYMLEFFKNTKCIEWWAGFFQYSSTTTTLFWVPQYAFQGWLLTGLILHNIKNRTSCENLLFLWALCLFGVPFIFVVLIPIIAAGVYLNKGKKLFSFQNTICTPAIIFIFGTYFSSRIFKDPSGFMGSNLNFNYIFVYILFIIFEFGLYAIILNKFFQKDLIWKTTVSSLILLPLFKFGGGNDLVMRGSAALLFIFFIYLIKFLFGEEKAKLRKIFVIILLMIGAFTPLLEISRSITNYSVQIPRPENQLSVGDLAKYRNNNQYLGNPKAFFWKYLAR